MIPSTILQFIIYCQPERILQLFVMINCHQCPTITIIPTSSSSGNHNITDRS